MITPVEREMITKIIATRFFEDVFIRPLFSRKEMKSKEREFLPPSRNSLIIMMEGRYGLDPALAGSGSSASEYGHFRIAVNQVCCECNLFKGLQSSS
jgi:hypothetical protein